LIHPYTIYIPFFNPFYSVMQWKGRWRRGCSIYCIEGID